MADNITVSIKVRPLIKREKDSKLTSQWRIRDNTISHVDGKIETFVFDNIFDETISTKELFDKVCRPIIVSVLNGINGTIFAYGQTSSGKTYTMMGDEMIPGVVPLAAREIFKEIENNKDRQFLIRVGYIEIYNEKIFDLLDKSNGNLKIFDNQCGDVSLNYKEVITNCPEQIMQYLEEGNKLKRIGDTNMNERSSRSHTIFRVTIESRNIGDENEAVQISTLNLVDLAGSERADQTGATGSRLKEGAHINKSLLSLSCVIQKLSENADNFKYINYRDSKLTRILQASIGGNAVTSMICNITPAALDESYYTLCFAMRAKTIKNKPIVNEVISEAAMMKRLEREIKRLQEELKTEQSKNSKIKTLELQNAITMRANQIINSQTQILFDKSRRRTWCPSSSNIPKPVTFIEQDSRLMPPPPPFLAMMTTPFISSSTPPSEDDNSPTIRPELANRCNSELVARKVRSATPSRQFLTVDGFDRSDEFVPGELADFGERSPRSLARDIHTPCALRSKRRSRRSSTGDSPANFVDYEKKCKELEVELRELQEFTNLEKNTDLAVIKQQLSSREELRDNLKCKEERVDNLEERCKDFEIELHRKREQIFDMEKELIVARKEREAAVKEAEQCRNIQDSVQVEYELFQRRAKTREQELIESLQEARSSATSKGDSQKQLDSARKELKQLEVHNYELQLKLEGCNLELEKLKSVEREQIEKLDKMKDVLERDIGRKDAKKLFRMVNKLRAIMADEADLLHNTSIDTDELVDSIEDTSFNDSLERHSPAKVVITNEIGMANVIYENGNGHVLDLNIENAELKKRIDLLEKETTRMKELLDDCEKERLKLAETEIRVNEIIKQLECEQQKVQRLNRALQEKKQELDKLTLEYDELSTQVMDNIQESDNYKDQIEGLERKLRESSLQVTELSSNLDIVKKSSSDEIQALSNKITSVESQLNVTRDQLFSLEEENKLLAPYKVKYENAAEEIKTLELSANKNAAELRALQEQYTQLDTSTKLLVEAKQELQQKVESLELVQEKHGQLESHFKEQQPKMKQLQDENHDLMVAVQELSAKIVALEEQMVKEECEIQQTNDSMNDSIKVKLETSLEMIKEETDAISETLPELEQIENKVRMLEEDKDNLSRELVEITAENMNLQAKYEQGAREILSCKAEHEAAVTRMTDLTATIEQLSAHNAELQEANILKESELQRISENLKKMTSDWSNLLAQTEHAKQEIKSTLQAEVSNCKQITELQIKTEQCVEELSTLKEEKVILIQQIESLKLEQQSILEEKKKVDEKCESLCNEVALLISDREKTGESACLALKTEITLLQQTKLDLEQEICTLKTQISSLEASLADVGEQRSKLLSKLQTLEAEMEDSSNIREHLEQEICTLKTQISSLEASLADVGEQRSKLLSKLQTLEAEMEDSSNIREHLEQEVRALKADLGNLEQQLNEYNEKVERYQKQNSEYQQELSEKTDEVERSTKEQNDLKNSIILLEQKVAVLQRENIDQISRTEDELKVKLVESEAAKEMQNTLIQALQKENKTLVENVKEISAERDLFKEQTTEKNLSLEQACRQVTSLENQIADLKLEIERTEFNTSEVEKLKECLEQEVCTLKKLLGAKEVDCAEKTIEIDDLKQNISELLSSVVNLEEKLSESEQRLTGMEKDVTNEREKLLRQIAEFRGQLETANSQHERSLKSEKEHSNELQRRIGGIEELKLALEQEVNISQENNKLLIEKHAKLIEANQQLEQSTVQTGAQLANLQAELAIREEKLKNVSHELSAKKAELEDLQLKYRRKSSEFETVVSKKMHDTNEMVQQIKELEWGKTQLQEQLKDERSKLLYLSENQIPSMKTTIQQLSEHQEVLKTKLLASADEISRKSLEIQRLTQLSEQEKSNSERLAQQLEEAKVSPALQPDGRPSLGDSKVAQALRKENEDLLKQLTELQKTHLFKTKQLQDRIDELKQIEVEYGKLKDEVSTMRHESSFQEKETQLVELREKIHHYQRVYEETNSKHRSLQRQNDELRVKHQNLVMEMDDLRRIADKDRKSRRQSTHDDRRGVSFNTRDSATMTDPTSTACSCLEMDAQIKELRRQLKIKDCQLSTQKLMASANPLKNDVIELRGKIRDRECEILKLQDETRSLSMALDQERKQAEKRCGSCARQQRLKSLRSDKAVATDREDTSANALLLQEHVKKLDESQEELRKLNEKYQQMKRLCRIRNEKIVSLSQDIMEKENESSNANVSVQQELSRLKRQLKESEDKCTQIQRLYQTRLATSKADKLIQTDVCKNDEVEMLRAKYEKYKLMAIGLAEQNRELERKLPST